jgi:hypothetical protein
MRFLLGLVFLALGVALVHCVGGEIASGGTDGGAEGSAGSDAANEQDGTFVGSDAGGDQDGAATDGGARDSAPADAARCTPDASWGTPQIVSELNENSSRNLGAALSDDELTVYFSSNRLRDGGVGAYAGFDVFSATRATYTGTFAGIQRLPVSDPSASVPELFASQTSTGLRLYFDTYRTGRGVWVSTRPGITSDYITASPIDVINGGGGENGTPHVLPDESAVYFSTSRGGAGFDIYRAPIVGGIVGSPAPVGGGVNVTSVNELNIAVTPDDLTIYFGSARDNTGYDFDIWVATRPNKSVTFSNLTKLPPAINDRSGGTTANFPTHVTADNCILYFGRQVAGVEQIWRVQRN